MTEAINSPVSSISVRHTQRRLTFLFTSRTQSKGLLHRQLSVLHLHKHLPSGIPLWLTDFKDNPKASLIKTSLIKKIVIRKLVGAAKLI